MESQFYSRYARLNAEYAQFNSRQARLAGQNLPILGRDTPAFLLTLANLLETARTLGQGY